MKKIGKLISVMFLAITLCMPMNTHAFDILGVVGELVDTYFPEVEFDVIAAAITELLNMDWFGNISTEEKIEKVKEILTTMGVPEEYITVTVDNIMKFAVDGQDFFVVLEDLADDLLWGDVELDPEYEIYGNVDKDAYILYGLGFKEIENSLESLSSRWESQGLNTIIDDYVTVEEFKTNLLGKDLVIIEEHGNYDFLDTPMICTREKYSKESYAAYENDIDNGRVYPVITDEGTFYWIHPSFFQYYYGNGKLNGTMVWLGSCCGYKSSDLANAFLSSGATTVIGHSETVYTAYDYYMLEASVGAMINGKEVDDALAEAKGIWGSNDIEWARQHTNFSEIKSEVAYPLMGGYSDLRF